MRPYSDKEQTKNKHMTVDSRISPAFFAANVDHGASAFMAIVNIILCSLAFLVKQLPASRSKLAHDGQPLNFVRLISSAFCTNILNWAMNFFRNLLH